MPSPRAVGARLVAGVDSSTQPCKVVIRDAETGALVRQGRASHPDGTEVNPDAWWEALQVAIEDAGVGRRDRFCAGRVLHRDQTALACRA